MNGKILLTILAFFCAGNAFAQKENVGVEIAETEKGTKEIAQLKEAMQRFDNAADNGEYRRTETAAFR